MGFSPPTLPHRTRKNGAPLFCVGLDLRFGTGVPPAHGGQLIEAVFPQGKVEINRFRKLKQAAGADRDRWAELPQPPQRTRKAGPPVRNNEENGPSSQPSASD